jgi:hypothetical protein
MEKKHSPEDLDKKAAELEATAAELRFTAQKARDREAPDGAKLQAISPRTKLPVEHPESQAVERILYEAGQSLCGQPTADAALEDLLKKEPKK